MTTVLWTVLPLLQFLMWAARSGLPVCFWAWWLRIWQGDWEFSSPCKWISCFSVYQIAQHSINTEPSTQPRSPAQVPNHGEFGLQEWVCKKWRQKISRPFPLCYCPLSPTVSGTHIQYMKSWVISTWLCLVFSPCQIPNIDPRRISLSTCMEYCSLSQSSCDETVSGKY